VGEGEGEGEREGEREREREREREINRDVGVGCPTGFRFLNFRVINLLRHRQRRHECACVVDATIVLIQISLIRSLTLSSPSLPPSLSLSLSLSLCFTLHFSPEKESLHFSVRRRHVHDMYEWAFNRVVMYCNRFVASESCTPLRDPLRKARVFVTKSLSIYLYGYVSPLRPPPPLSLSLSLSLLLSSPARS